MPFPLSCRPIPPGLSVLGRALMVCGLASLAACGGGGTDSPAADAPATPAAAPSAPVDGLRFTLAAAPVLPGGTLPAPSGLYRCGNLALGTVSSGNIDVPAGEVCVLQGTRVGGNVQLGRGSVLDARDVRIDGNLQADGAASVLLAGTSTVNGSVQLKQGAQASVLGARIEGDLQLDDHGAALVMAGNSIGGNLQVKDNRGGVTLEDNRVQGNLQCQGNLPVPVGARNSAASIEDQCRALLPAPGADAPSPANPPVAPVPPGAGSSLPPAMFASGSNVLCSDVTLGEQTYANVTVAAGARCDLRGTRLTGNLLLQPGAQADVRDSQVEGSVQADGADVLQISGGSVQGALQVERGRLLTLSNLAVTGAVQVKVQTGLVWLQGLRGNGDLQLFGNRGGVTLNDNQFGGNLQCKDNLPAPTGSGNRAAAKEDQCRAL